MDGLQNILLCIMPSNVNDTGTAQACGVLALCMEKICEPALTPQLLEGKELSWLINYSSVRSDW